MGDTRSEAAGIEAAREAGRLAWPDLMVVVESFAEMAARTDATHLALWSADLYLACAAGGGHPLALAAVDRTCIAAAATRIRRLGATTDEVDEALQATRERLLVGPHPKILSYNATAPLKNWVQVTAVRTAIDLRRSRGRHPNADESALGLNVIDPTPDAPTLLLKATYREAFQAALTSQIGALSPRDRAILKMHLLEGISVERIAEMRGVHRVTVARWIWGASETMLTGVRDIFLARFGIVPGECDSLVNLIRSQLTLDWSQIFRE